VVRHRRRDAREALARCLPERTPAEQKRILNAMYRHLGMTVFEQLRISVHGLRVFEKRIDIDGLDTFRAAATSPHGSLVLMAHLGNWELCGYASQLSDCPISVVVKKMRSPRFEAYLTRTREQMNLRMLPAGTSIRACIKALRQGEFLAMILDQNSRRSRGVFVDFFGRPACTTTGLALLAAQTQIPVFPIFVLRCPNGRYRMIIQDPVPPPADRKPESMKQATQQYTRILEDMIRAHPEQWIWIHRRWRSQPESRAEAPATPGGRLEQGQNK
jgi:KDO2-lipid IV(A) lauroyltransferase